ncbi:IS4 family transposase [Symbiopectobacterium sp. Eva_TO]
MFTHEVTCRVDEVSISPPLRWPVSVCHYILMNKRMPKGRPKLNEVLRLVAQLGGFLARKGDGEPGAKTIWKGLQKVMTAAETLRALRHEQRCV